MGRETTRLRSIISILRRGLVLPDTNFYESAYSALQGGLV